MDTCPQTSQLTTIHCDNLSMIALANNPFFHARTKEVKIDFQFVRDYVRRLLIQLKHIPSADQPADILMKSLPTLFNYVTSSRLMPYPLIFRGIDKLPDTLYKPL